MSIHIEAVGPDCVHARLISEEERDTLAEGTMLTVYAWLPDMHLMPEGRRLMFFEVLHCKIPYIPCYMMSRHVVFCHVRSALV